MSSSDYPAHFELETVHEVSDPSAGLSGVIAIDSLRLGPAAGGCRFWRYADRAALVADARRLAEGMSYKNALAGLPLGGGKAVLQRPHGEFDRARLFAAFGRAVEKLGGNYVTAEDVGTTMADMAAVAGATDHVAGLPPAAGRAGGDPAPWTARGVFLAMEAAVQRQFGSSLEGSTVAVQGLGNVGYALCRLLHGAGARLFVAEPRAEVAERAVAEFGATLLPANALFSAPADVLAPCALGGVLHEGTIAVLKARVVCGAANNQLATPEDGARLADRGVLYAPDYLVNAGGIINVAAEHLGWSSDEAAVRIDRIAQRLNDLLDQADSAGMPTNLAADSMAREIIAAGPAGSHMQQMPSRASCTAR